MSKPTDNELRTAISAAIKIKEQGTDSYFVAKSLLNLCYRMKYYEELLKVADRYMNHGQADHERMELLKSIEHIKELESRIANMDLEDFGLE